MSSDMSGLNLEDRRFLSMPGPRASVSFVHKEAACWSAGDPGSIITLLIWHGMR